MPNAPMAHCHNDTLSLELWVNKIPILIDPGTFCYTFDIEKRNYFRSTLMHNTVTVNNEEINPLNKNTFYLNWQTNFTCKDWSILPGEIRFIGEHDAFNNRFGIIIRRSISYYPNKYFWSIKDEIIGNNLSNHNIISKWILNPDLNFQYNKSSNNGD